MWHSTLPLLLLVNVATLTMISTPPACPPECICLSQTQVLCNSGGLTEIPVKLLPSTVEHLSLTRNNFPLIRSDAFAGLRALRKLSLDGNTLNNIKPFAFRGLPRLREISIQQTPLMSVPQFSFAGLQNISAIYLSHNKIKKVECYAFAGTTNLKLLVLANNPLIKLESNAFSGLSIVERITFPSGLRIIEPDAFNGLDTVGYIKLAFMDLPAVKNGTFRGLNNIGVLSIQESDLGVIRPGAFDGISYIGALNFLNNKIDAIQELIFTPDQRIRALKFQGNHILDIPRVENVYFAVSRLTVIANHFPCDCHIHALIEGPFANDSVFEFVTRNYCISPLDMNGRAMSELDFDSIGRCQEEVTRSNLESKDVASSSRASSTKRLDNRAMTIFAASCISWVMRWTATVKFSSVG